MKKDNLSEAEMLKLLHELEERQIELEMMNEELILSRDALFKSEELLSLFLRHSPIFAYIKEVTPFDSRTLKVSENFQEMIGIPGSQMIGKNMYELFPAELAAKITADDWTVVSEGKLLKMEEGLNGRIYSTIKYPISQGGKNLLAGYNLDITDLKLAEAALRESEEIFRLAFNTSPDSITIVRLADGVLVSASEGFLKMSGYTQEEVIGKTASEINSWKDPEDRRKFVEEIRSRGEVRDYEAPLLTKSGEIYGLMSASIIYLSGEPHILNITRDITERKRSEIAMRKINDKLIRAQRVAHIGSWEDYLPTNEMNWSDEMFNIMGFPISTSVNLEEVICVFPPEELERFKQAVDSAVNNGVPYSMDYRIVRLDGKTLYIHDEGEVMFDEHGKAILMFGTSQDITDHKLVEQELTKAKDQAQESDRLKSAFLANMSHEIRTPMNGILGFAGLLKEPDLTGEEQQEFISMIEKSGARMLNIINDIVDISKIESGQMEISISESNVNEQIEYVYSFFKPEVEKKNLQFSFKNRLPFKEAVIKTDREKIYAILTNLVKNAIKFTNEGSIEFGYDLVETDNYPSLRQYQFFVKDTGIGIPQDRQEVIFERFAQADISDKQAYQGAGLGLSIAKAYVEMLGGKIWVESEPGKGSIFYFTIPCHAEPEKEVAVKTVVSEKKETNPIKNLKILIADDDEASQMYISLVINKFSSEVLKAVNGVEAIQICRNNPDIDLILMDIKMPEMDGYEATRQIRQFNSAVIIIAQTAFALTGEREKVIAAGCNDYIAKPIKKDQLVELINQYFKKKYNSDNADCYD